MVDKLDEFRRFEDMMNRMFEEFWGRTRRRLLPPSQRGEIVLAQPFIDVIEPGMEVIATVDMAALEKIEKFYKGL